MTARWVELLTLYLIAPSLIVLGVIDLPFRWPIFCATLMYVVIVLLQTKPGAAALGMDATNWRRLVVWTGAYTAVVILTLTTLRLTGVVTASTFLFSLLVLTAYPLVSAPLQELFFRSFFFHRYDGLAPPPLLAALNVLLFAFYHRIFGGWLAAGLSVAGGVVLTTTFLRSRNFWIVTAVHGVLGVLVFLTGLGPYFTDLLR